MKAAWALAAAAFLSACGAEETAGGSAPGAPATGRAAELEELVALSYAATDEATATIGESLPIKVPARVVPPAPAPETAPIPPPFPPPPAPVGALAATYSAPITALAILDDGRTIASIAGELVLRGPAGAKVLRPSPAQYLQLSHDGSRLLAQQDGTVTIFEGTDFESARDLPASHPKGRAWWMDTQGRLLFVNEVINYDASVPERIYLDTNCWDIAEGTTCAVGWSPFRKFAFVGTVAGANGVTIWGHRIRPFEIDPRPAPALAIEAGEATEALTATEDARDHLVHDGPGGRYWLRTVRAASEAGRAFRLESGTSTQLSGVPTWALAVSPRGEAVAMVVETGPKSFELRTITAAELPREAPAFAAFAARDADIRAKGIALRTAVAASFSGATKDGMLAAPPRLADVEAAAGAAVAALKQHFGADPAAPDFLRRVDGALDAVDGALEETPAAVMALAGIYAASSRGGRWHLDGADPSLTVDVKEPLLTDGISFIAACPFGIARERIAGRWRLAEIAARVSAAAPEGEPLWLVENFRMETLTALQRASLIDGGIDPAKFEYAVLAAKVPSARAALALYAYDAARERGDAALQWTAAARIVRLHPALGAAWQLLGDALDAAGDPDAARRAYAEAALLAPDSAEIRYRLADFAYILGDLDGAKAEYERARAADAAGIFAEDIQRRMALIEEARAKP